MGKAKEFLLTWMRDSVATCDYIVEWCMLGFASPCNLQWRKVAVNQTSLNLDTGIKLFVYGAYSYNSSNTKTK